MTTAQNFPDFYRDKFKYHRNVKKTNLHKLYTMTLLGTRSNIHNIGTTSVKAKQPIYQQTLKVSALSQFNSSVWLQMSCDNSRCSHWIDKINLRMCIHDICNKEQFFVIIKTLLLRGKKMRCCVKFAII